MAGQDHNLKNEMPPMKVSIITPSFNQSRYLPDTLRSVREQDYRPIEHIVVDGGSTDGSQKILRKAPGIRWLSEPDRGQVDAINKGFRLATGDILAWLNSDDTMNPDTVSAAVAALERTGADLVYGDLDIVDEHGAFIRQYCGIPFDLRVLLYGIDYIGQQTVFFRRSLLEKAGPLREEYDNGFDYELWVRMARYGRLVYAPEIRAQIRVHAAAKSVANVTRTKSDNAKIRAEYWADGGLPSCLQRQLFAKAINYWYRLRRQSRVWRRPRNTRRRRILMLGYLPPPIHGAAVAYQALLRSELAYRFDVAFINMSVARDFKEMEVFRPLKLVRAARYFGSVIGRLLLRRPEVYFYPLSFNRNTFLKDVLMLAPARFLAVPIVVYAHGNGLPEFRARSPRWLQRLIDRAVRWVAVAVVPGRSLRFNFLQHLPEDRVLDAIYGVETPKPLLEPARDPDRFTVLYLGNLIREKGVFVLLDTIPQVLAKRPEARFVLAGAWWSDTDRLEAERFIRKHQLEGRVEFTGVVAGDAKWRVLARADVLVFPTFYPTETLGQVLLEGMAMGLPVIATRRAAIPEVIEEGVNGLFVEEQDPAQLGEKILQLAGDPAMRARMGRANREKFEGAYTHRHFGRRIIAVFDALLVSRGD